MYCDGKPLQKKRRKILVPGEMEQVELKKADLENFPDLKEIVIRTEVI